ncbi:hypothetical protein [Methylocaldum sp.]|uniref:hypothetical protein n=1 Tax=Methylocaldum sp. TaxID=1969727 RepID=UPI002D530439|nr:hypothetical protein [Methylocaldum sp.]HYE36922.1 hypothetical protein [Methylocaldum sp.]
MKVRILLAVLAMFGLLASCAEPSRHPMDMSVAVQSAKTGADHQALADHYEAVARDMENKAEEHRQILAEFRKDPHDYPREYKGGSFEAHCKRLIDIYERAAAANRDMAEDHRQMAGGAR